MEALAALSIIMNFILITVLFILWKAFCVTTSNGNRFYDKLIKINQIIAVHHKEFEFNTPELLKAFEEVLHE